MSIIGFFNAFTIPLSGSNLSIYLTEEGIEKATIGLFSLFTLPFSCKLLWMPVIDYVRLYFVKPRKGWLALSLFLIGACFFSMSLFSPSTNFLFFSLSVFFLSSFAGLLYMVGLSYELESLDRDFYATGSSFVVTSYRVGLLVAGAGALYLAHTASWQVVYQISALVSLLSGLYILLVSEPAGSKKRLEEKKASSIQESFVDPVTSFFKKENWKYILFVVLLFKTGDHLEKVMEGPFLLGLGFDKRDLALATKSFGFAATLLGGVVSAMMLKKKEPLQAIVLFSLLHAITLFATFFHAVIGKSFTLLYAGAFLTNMTGGLAMTSFIYFLWKVVDSRYQAVQYAILWSLFSCKGHLLACVGGFLATFLSWPLFFLVAAASALLATFLLYKKSSESVRVVV